MWQTPPNICVSKVLFQDTEVTKSKTPNFGADAGVLEDSTAQKKRNIVGLQSSNPLCKVRGSISSDGLYSIVK